MEEVTLLCQGLQLAVKTELTVAESSFQNCDEFGAEQTAEHLDRKEKLAAARNPVTLVGRDPAAGNDAVEVRMMMKVCPQVCSTAKKPIRAPRCLGSAAICNKVSAAAWKRMP